MAYYGLVVLAFGVLFFFSGFLKLWEHRDGRGQIGWGDYKNAGRKINVGLVLCIAGALVIVGSFF